jgi:hypothetical protein
LILALGAVVALAGQWRTRLGSGFARVGVTAAILTLVFAGAAAGYAGQRHYLSVRYTKEPGLKPVARLWRWARGVHGARIAFAGTFGWYFGYPLYGTDASNRVAYIGHRGSHGSFTGMRSCREWRRAINAGRYRYVVVSASRAMWTGAVTSSPEIGWTETDRGVERVSPRYQRNWALEVFLVRGRLDPSGCPAPAPVRPARTGSRRSA